MIARLLGKLVDRSGGVGIVDVGGVGYEILSPVRALDDWNLTDDPILVHVSTQVREDAITLYGFPTRREREAFQVLLGVSGIGPKIALAALDTLDVDALAQAVETDDLLTLSKISGVGKKSAQRMALELKGKLAVDFVPTTGSTKPTKRRESDMLPLALARLDYGKSEIDKALQALGSQGLGPDADLQERLRAALRFLSSNQ